MKFKQHPVAADLAARMCPKERESIIDRRLSEMKPRVREEGNTLSAIAVFASGAFVVAMVIVVAFAG